MQMLLLLFFPFSIFLSSLIMLMLLLSFYPFSLFILIFIIIDANSSISIVSIQFIYIIFYKNNVSTVILHVVINSNIINIIYFCLFSRPNY